MRCHNDRVCLRVSTQCDGVDNCGDNSDELNCRELWEPAALTSPQSISAQGIVVKFTVAVVCVCGCVCNQTYNRLICVCVLPEVPPAVPSCEKDEFLCNNGRCISSNLRCNFFNDCEDYGSDEISCKTGASLHLKQNSGLSPR